ncbi:MAG: hypothetical protein ACLFU1_06645 [Alphaproteobacteria bacterium]
MRLLWRNVELQKFVIEKLKSYWAPEQIAGYLKRLGIRGFYACMETIEDYIAGGLVAAVFQSITVLILGLRLLIHVNLWILGG